ncbi:hypothetical protein M7I_3615 [Glarea lozoyensis 74030]|uniref:Uncharacterized protein n=1 Tax=Glarea lozoyensis (strain ATCC 74030 / MF5533) TaxID=1104152 RepID=H0ELZ0_GLAL7|nr:hypothetical protein M7I_3615 [Glarea lozoyensis 74030]
MAIKQAAWTHGLGVELEFSSWTAFRQGFFTTVRPSAESKFGWVHFVIPTPVIVDGTRLRAESAMVRFSTGSGAKITNFHVYGGETKIANYNGLSLSGNLQFVREAVPNSHRVLWGTAISLGVQFTGAGPNDFIQFISAGIDFYAQRNIYLKVEIGDTLHL